MAGEMTPDTGSDLIPGENDLTVTFLAQGTQTGAQIATMLSGFIAGATRTLDIAAYDFRLEPRPPPSSAPRCANEPPLVYASASPMTATARSWSISWQAWTLRFREPRPLLRVSAIQARASAG